MQSLEDQLQQLSPEDLIKLTSGADFWRSAALPKHQIPSFRMSDGPMDCVIKLARVMRWE